MILISFDRGRLRMINILDHINHHMVISQKNYYHMRYKSMLHNISTTNTTFQEVFLLHNVEEVHRLVAIQEGMESRNDINSCHACRLMNF